MRIHRFELPNPAFKFFTLLKSKNDPDGFCFYLIANLDDLKYDAQLYGARQNILCFSRQLFSEKVGSLPILSNTCRIEWNNSPLQSHIVAGNTGLKSAILHGRQR